MSKKAGVTLTEIMLAVAILAFAILPMAGIIHFVMSGSREQDAEGIAANLAKEEMNRLLYVINRDNLLMNAQTPRPWSFAESGFLMETRGNVYEGMYVVFPHDNSNLNFNVPVLEFHNPYDCADGKESHNNIVDATPESLNMAQVYPEIGEPLMADILLRVRWRTPRGNFRDPDQLTLVARRSFLVTE